MGIFNPFERAQKSAFPSSGEPAWEHGRSPEGEELTDDEKFGVFQRGLSGKSIEELRNMLKVYEDEMNSIGQEAEVQAGVAVNRLPGTMKNEIVSKRQKLGRRVEELRKRLQLLEPEETEVDHEAA